MPRTPGLNDDNNNQEFLLNDDKNQKFLLDVIEQMSATIANRSEARDAMLIYINTFLAYSNDEIETAQAKTALVGMSNGMKQAKLESEKAALQAKLAEIQKQPSGNISKVGFFANNKSIAPDESNLPQHTAIPVVA